MTLETAAHISVGWEETKTELQLINTDKFIFNNNGLFLVMPAGLGKSTSILVVQSWSLHAELWTAVVTQFYFYYLTLRWDSRIISRIYHLLFSTSLYLTFPFLAPIVFSRNNFLVLESVRAAERWPLVSSLPCECTERALSGLWCQLSQPEVNFNL